MRPLVVDTDISDLYADVERLLDGEPATDDLDLRPSLVLDAILKAQDLIRRCIAGEAM
jgi:hypothetical protein